MDYNKCYNNFNDLYRTWADQKIALDKMKRRITRSNIMLMFVTGTLLAVMSLYKNENDDNIAKLKTTIEGLKRTKGE